MDKVEPVKAEHDFEAWLREEAKARTLAACHYDYGERELQEAFAAAMRVAYARGVAAALIHVTITPESE